MRNRRRARAVCACGALLSPAHARTGPWVNKVRKPVDVPNCTAAVAAAIARPSTCVPDGWALLSMTNAHHAPLQALQFERVASLSCLMTRLVRICYGTVQTVPDTFGTCVYGPHVIPSDYRRSQYVSLNWAKWPFFLDALLAAPHILWIEADVVILRNPFEALLAPAERERTLTHAIRYQGEGPPCRESAPGVGDGYANESAVSGCDRAGKPHDEPLNCGQLVVNSRPLALAIWEARPDNFTNGAFSQQHYANVEKERWPHSYLPITFYSFHWRGTKVRRPCGLTTYHITGLSDSKSKANAMRIMLKQTAGCANASAKAAG